MQSLVLNLDYQAIALCEPERALVLVLEGKAELIAPVDGRYFRSVRQRFPVPSVIRLRRYLQLPFQRVALTRHNVFRRDGFRCAYCGSVHDLSLDHVLPRAQGGKTHWKNLVTACRPCNSRKGDRTPEEAGLELPVQPFRPSFIMFLTGTRDLQPAWKPYLFL
jgi:5-methylcytosine-specific restriction endonuclease McrA